MINSLNASNNAFLASVNAIKSRLDTAQRQLSTGRRLDQPADAPDQISELLLARASLASTQTANKNLGRVKTEVDSAEAALGQASKAIEQARVLGTEGANATNSAASRETLADQVGATLEQLVGISRTAVEGRYIFSGDADQTPSYTIDLTQTNPISAYQGSATSTRLVQHPNGTTFGVAETAQQIFDPTNSSDNIFSSLVALRGALKANDTAGISSALDSLTTASAYFERQTASYGIAQNKVADASSYGSSLELNLTTQIANIQDADATQAILELTQSQTALSAALQSKAKIQTQSLFDYLR